eukprot:GHVR01174169.1.p1 GENE.GHVR01174169.1~~GHVR01174169.1.p1  ORF type:complete len:237 (-),score=19.67 GHVR01174169.1:70-780(-)
MCLIYALSRKWEIGITDVVTAFLQAELDPKIIRYIRLPSHLPPEAKKTCPEFVPGGVYRLKGNMYGLDFAPRVYTQWFKRVVESQGWSQIDESIFVKFEKSVIEALLVMYVDDLLLCSRAAQQHINALKKFVSMDDGNILTVGKKIKYLGMDIELVSANQLHLHMNKYLLSLHPNVVSKTALADKHIRHKFHLDTHSAQPHTIKEFQQKMGQLMWVSNCRPDLAYCLGELQTLWIV